jgi:expansin (peptidoglycan-binding protein)
MMMNQVRCKIPQYCDRNGAYLVVTDYGAGDRTDFIMSPNAFSKLGRNAAASAKLVKYGVVDIEYKRVPCKYGSNIKFQINENSRNPGYFAVLILYVDGTYDVTAVEMWQVYIYIYTNSRMLIHTIFQYTKQFLNY